MNIQYAEIPLESLEIISPSRKEKEKGVRQDKLGKGKDKNGGRKE